MLVEYRLFEERGVARELRRDATAPRSLSVPPSTAARLVSSSRVTVSSSAMPTCVSLMRRRLKPCASAACISASALAVSIAMVSKNASCSTRWPRLPRRIGQHPGLQVDPPRDALQSLRPMPHRIACRRSPPAAPATYRCSTSPSRAGCAARASATPAASPVRRRHRATRRPAVPACAACRRRASRR